MSIREWFMHLVGRSEPNKPERDALSKGQKDLAGRLSKLTGKNRDEVLAESYRRGDVARRRAMQIEVESVRRR